MSNENEDTRQQGGGQQPTASTAGTGGASEGGGGGGSNAGTGGASQQGGKLKGGLTTVLSDNVERIIATKVHRDGGGMKKHGDGGTDGVKEH